jgi:flagellar M-ring protein FliF
MADFFRKLFDQLRGVYGSLNVTQRIVLLLSAVGMIILIALLVFWSRSGERYDVLYSNLSQKDAGAIVEKLKDLKVPYHLEESGTAILVPQEQVYDLRLELAGEGLPQIGGIGYEIFDKTQIGMTDFVQRVNYRRALEGELSRTIQQLAEVKTARIHLVIPEDALFKEDQKQTTASVVITLRPNAKLSKAQIRGIAVLVARSIEGLDERNVVIVDSFGNILTIDDYEPGALATRADAQLEMQRKIESYLTMKTLTMLDKVIGEENVEIRVNADLDFDKVDQHLENVDPDNTVVVSEEIEKGGGAGGDSASNANRQHIITNYEIGRTVEQIERSQGTIKHLSVAAFIDGIWDTVATPDGVRVQYNDRTQAEMDKITGIIKNAVGYNPDRGDYIDVQSIQFKDISAEEQRLIDIQKSLIKEKEDLTRGFQWRDIIPILTYAIPGLIIIFALIIGFRFYLQKSRERAIRERERREREEMERRSQALDQFRRQLPQEAAQMILEHPDVTARLLRTWLASSPRLASGAGGAAPASGRVSVQA